MLTNISWATFLIVMVTALIAWYCLIGFTQYYKNIKTFLNKKRSLQFSLYGTMEDNNSPNTETLDNLTSKGVFEEPHFQDFEMIEELVERVKGLTTEAVERNTPKKDFMVSLSKILDDYPLLKKSQFRPSVNEFIATECELQGIKDIAIEEVEDVWKIL